MITTKDKATITAIIRSIDPRNAGDKRQILDAVAAELGMRQQQGLAQTDHVLPCREAALRLNMSPRTLCSAIRQGDIKAVRKRVTGRSPRSVGVAASEVNSYIRRMSGGGQGEAS